MKSRLWFVVLLLGGIPLYSWWQAVPTSADTVTKPALALRPSSQAPQYLGAGSCAASACHNGNFTNGHTGSEFTLWMTRDRHAKAYETLFEDRAQQIQQNLDSLMPAHEDQRCLNCHVAPNLDANAMKKAPYFKTDGVSCESCHGPAERWVNVHHLDSWQRKTPAEKREMGMNDTQSLLGRTQVCVKCHVGVPGMEVNHDLIAAGHPRLHFEFAAFHAFMPRHWPDAKDRNIPDFEARAWAMGQLVATQASLELLADRASDPKKPWPEFAEHDCAACHHDLQSPSRWQTQGFGKRKPGAFPWGSYLSGTRQLIHDHKDPQLDAIFDKLQKSMDTGKPNRQELAANARLAASLLEPIQKALERKPFERIWLDDRFRSSLRETAGSQDHLTQMHLGLFAMYSARDGMKTPLPADLRSSFLRLTRDLERPQAHDPEAIRKRLMVLKKLGDGAE